MTAAAGAFITPFTRAAQFMGDKAAQYVPAVNQYLGNLTMRAQPTVQRVTGGSPPMPLSVQGRETLVQGPAGTIAEGVGTKLAPYTTMGPLMSPTFTEGIKMGVQRTAQEYPRVAEALSRMSPALGLGAGSLMALPFMKGASNENMSPEQVASYNDKMAQLAAIDQIPSPSRTQQAVAPAAPVAEKPVFNPLAMEPVRADEFGTAEPEKKSTQDFIKTAIKEKTRGERIREGYAELSPLFSEILGSDKEDMKTNALLMLADAGFKLASSRQPTMAMALGEAASGLPKGFMALLAQSKDRDLKIKSAALSQAFSDVQEQDKYAQQIKMKVLDGDFRLLLEQIKKNPGAVILEDGVAGLRIAKTKDGGSFIDAKIDPADPTVQTAVRSRFTLRDTDNPFVENRGEAPTAMETDKGERLKLTASLRALDDSLSKLDNLKGTYAQLYSPGTWFQDKINNVLVPVSGGLIRPDVNQAAAQQQLTAGLEGVIKGIATANDNGRVAVQEQKWVRDNNNNILFPVGFFENKELAAKGIEGLYTDAVNARQRILTQLGYEKNEYVRRVASTGTQSDPFVIPADKDSQRVMFTYLGSTIGKMQDPKAMVHVRMPNNTIQQFNPTQLRGLIGNQ
jgi:hypothetical protein